ARLRALLHDGPLAGLGRRGDEAALGLAAPRAAAYHARRATSRAGGRAAQGLLPSDARPRARLGAPAALPGPRPGPRVQAAQRDVDVVLAGEVPARADERVVVEDVEDARDRQQHVVLADLDVVEAREIRVLAVAAALAVAVTTAVATPAAAAPALVVQLLAVVA